jgi:hypothetical protein
MNSNNVTDALNVLGILYDPARSFFFSRRVLQRAYECQGESLVEFVEGEHIIRAL